MFSRRDGSPLPRGPSKKAAAPRLIEAVETLVRIHTAQEEDIYEAVVAR
jgi:hypothetical protein